MFILNNKEILTSYLVLQSMQTLYEYKKLYPLYFSLVHKTIRFDENCDNFLPEKKESFEIGEKINAIVYEFFEF